MRVFIRAAIVTLLLATSAAAEPTLPNIVFILADDVGCEPLGCYGGTSYPTPSINRLAETGMRFTHAYSMPVCHPTRTTFLLGEYPMHSGAANWGGFPESREGRTVAHVMKAAGYQTVVAGKWQLALLGKDLDQPHRLGFDEYCLFGWHEGARYHDPYLWQNGKLRDDTDGTFGPDQYVDFLIDFMTRNQQKPFFAFYSMALCHDVTDDLAAPVPYAPGKNRYLNYAEMVAAMDVAVGKIVAAIDQLHLTEKTLIIFTGDNGTAKGSISTAQWAGSGRKGWKYLREPVVSEQNGKAVPGGKGNLTDDGTNVPLICNWPGQIPERQVVDDLVDFSDFLPTFAALARSEPGPNFGNDGISFASRLHSNEPSPRTWALAQHKGKHWVRTHRWKLYDDGRFYDVASDPREKNDLSKNIPRDSDYALLRDAMETL